MKKDNESKILENFFESEKSVHKLFEYIEDWVKIPLADYRDLNWMLIENEDSSGKVIYSEKTSDITEDLLSSGQNYSSDIYTQRFLSKWVYKSEFFTLISIDTRVDGNKYLAIFDNSFEVKATPELIKAELSFISYL
jgi:hypothetical protein